MILETYLGPILLAWAWERDNVGFRIVGTDFHQAIFVDNIVLIAKNQEDAQRMLNDITQCVLDLGLQWKPASLEFMTAGGLRNQPFDLYTWSSGNYVPITQREYITTLCTKLDPEGSTTTGSNHDDCEMFLHMQHDPLMLSLVEMSCTDAERVRQHARTKLIMSSDAPHSTLGVLQRPEFCPNRVQLLLQLF